MSAQIPGKAIPGKVSMTGKTVVITGGTSGIGQVAAEALAGMGARIVLVARDRTRGRCRWGTGEGTRTRRIPSTMRIFRVWPR